MKLLFLLSQDDFSKQFTFEPYKMGPFSSDVYPQLDFLQNFPSPEKPFVESKKGDELSGLTPENLRIVDEMAEEGSPVTNEEINKPFYLSDVGVKVAGELWTNLEPEHQKIIEKTKSQFGSLSLKELLRYVYSRYPDMTVNSEIKDQL